MRYKYFLKLIIFISIAAVLFSGCGGGGGSRNISNGSIDGTRHWTILVYMAADNDLEKNAIEDINEMEFVGSTPEVSIVVQVDRAEGYDSSNGNWTGTRRYLINKDSNPSQISSTLLSELGEQDMADSGTLSDFINWASTEYPAENTLLMLWDHGRGWQDPRTRTLSLPREIKALNIDYSSGNEMSLTDLRDALQNAPHNDIVAFDLCLMGMLEVAYAIEDQADIMVASEENVPGSGHRYNMFLSKLTRNPGLTPSALSRIIVDDYISYYSNYSGTFTLSAIDLTSLGSVVTATDQLAQSIISNPSVYGAVREAQQQAQHFDYDKNAYIYYKDLYDFARLVRNNVSKPQVRTAAQAVMDSVGGVVLYQKSLSPDMENSHGISIYLPNSGIMLSQYETTAFASDTLWDELLASY